MTAAIISEFRKLFTVRSTYVILLIALGLNVLFSFYVTGWHSPAEVFMRPGFLAGNALSSVNALSLFIGLISILLVTHEYRYNTIVYTLTASRSRTTVMLAKFLVISAFAVMVALLYSLLSMGMTVLAAEVRNFVIVPQQIDWINIIWRAALSGWGFAAFAFIIATIVRHQVGAIAIMFLLPSTIEQLLGLLLKQNQVYQPYTALAVLQDIQTAGSPISPSKAALIVLSYIVIGWIVAWVLFLRRDAN